MSDYPKTKTAGVLNIISAFFSIIAAAGIAFLIFTENFRMVPEGAETGFENLALIVLIPFTLIHIAVLFVAFLNQLLRGIRLVAASNSGEISLASYIVTLIFKLLYTAANAFAIYMYMDVQVGGMVAIILTSLAALSLFIIMIVEFSSKNEILYDENE